MVGLDAAAPPGPRPMAGGEAGGAVPPTFGAAPEPGRDRGRSPVAGQDPSGAFPGRTRLAGELGPEATPRFTAGEDGGRIPGRDRGHRHPRNRGTTPRRRSAAHSRHPTISSTLLASNARRSRTSSASRNGCS